MTERVMYELRPTPGGGWEVMRPLAARLQEFRACRNAAIAAGQALEVRFTSSAGGCHRRSRWMYPL